MDKLEFNGITIIYNKEEVNEEVCERKNRLLDLWCCVTTVWTFVMSLYFVEFAKNMPETLVIVIGTILLLIGIPGGMLLGHWFIYRKSSDTFLFMDKMFKVKEVYAGWKRNEIYLRTKDLSNKINDYSVREFIEPIENALVITDKSDRNGSIHVFIDVTSNNKTEVTIENTEETD